MTIKVPCSALWCHAGIVEVQQPYDGRKVYCPECWDRHERKAVDREAGERRERERERKRRFRGD